MRDSRIFRLGIVLVLAISIVVLIKCNVTATKEEANDSNESIALLNLEVNSELVQNIYSSLILLKNRALDDETYRYSYFNLKDKNTLSNEEKMYIAFESLYLKDKFLKEVVDDIENLKISEADLKEEINHLFHDDFSLIDVNYKSSLNCGIVDYLYTGTDYELKFKKCDEKHKGIDDARLESAVKDGNFVRLTVKSYYAVKNSKRYDFKNFISDDTFLTLNELDSNIIDNKEVSKYVFSFELKGDDYYLSNIQSS